MESREGRELKNKQRGCNERKAAKVLSRHTLAQGMEIPGVLWLLEVVESGIRMPRTW